MQALAERPVRWNRSSFPYERSLPSRLPGDSLSYLSGTNAFYVANCGGNDIIRIDTGAGGTIRMIANVS